MHTICILYACMTLGQSDQILARMVRDDSLIRSMILVGMIRPSPQAVVDHKRPGQIELSYENFVLFFQYINIYDISHYLLTSTPFLLS